MSSGTQKVLDICEQLPDLDCAEVADFAEFLLAKHKSGLEEDDAWERTIADGRHRPKLDEFVRAAMAEGSEPLDPEKIGKNTGSSRKRRAATMPSHTHETPRSTAG